MNSNFSKHTQKDGLRVILVPDSAKDVVTTMVMIGAGSRYESDEDAGISHALEHMFYKGTKKRPTSSAVSEFIEGLGGEFNAFTSKEYTGFYTKVASTHLSKSIDFLADLLVSPLFDEKELAKEKQIILQEYDMYEEQPMEVSASKFEEALFGVNSLGRDVIGHKESIAKITRESLLNYQASRYRSSNVVIVVAGNISALGGQSLLQTIEKSFIFPQGNVESHDQIKLPISKQLSVVQRKTEQTHLALGFRGVAYDSPYRCALKLLSIILGGSMSSRMFTQIREKMGLAYAVRTSVASYLDTGMVETYAGVPHEKVQEAIKAILNEYKKTLDGVSEAELSRAKEIIYGKMLISLEDTNALANHYALNELLLNKTLTPAEVIAKYKKVTLAEILGASKKYFNTDSMALSVVGPNILAEAVQKYITI